jgi:hypothetical protein
MLLSYTASIGETGSSMMIKKGLSALESFQHSLIYWCQSAGLRQKKGDGG